MSCSLNMTMILLVSMGNLNMGKMLSHRIYLLVTKKNVTGEEYEQAKGGKMSKSTKIYRW